MEGFNLESGVQSWLSDVFYPGVMLQTYFCSGFVTFDKPHRHICGVNDPVHDASLALLTYT